MTDHPLVIDLTKTVGEELAVEELQILTDHRRSIALAERRRLVTNAVMEAAFTQNYSAITDQFPEITVHGATNAMGAVADCINKLVEKAAEQARILVRPEHLWEQPE